MLRRAIEAAIGGTGGIGPAAYWTGDYWTGDYWTGDYWSGGDWTGGDWTGDYWTGGDWTGGDWSGGYWSGGYWSGGGRPVANSPKATARQISRAAMGASHSGRRIGLRRSYRLVRQISPAGIPVRGASVPA